MQISSNRPCLLLGTLLLSVASICACSSSWANYPSPNSRIINEQWTNIELGVISTDNDHNDNHATLLNPNDQLTNSRIKQIGRNIILLATLLLASAILALLLLVFTKDVEKDNPSSN